MTLVRSMPLLLKSCVPADYASLKPGTGPRAMNLLDEGTTTRTGEQLVEALGGLGATLSSGGGGETSFVSLSALKPALFRSMRLFDEVVLHPAFAPADFDRHKVPTVAGLAYANPARQSTATRIMPTLRFGADSAMGQDRKS